MASFEEVERQLHQVAEQAQLPLQRDLRACRENRPRADVLGQHVESDQQSQTDCDQRQQIAIHRYDNIVEYELKADGRRDDDCLHQERQQEDLRKNLAITCGTAKQIGDPYPA